MAHPRIQPVLNRSGNLWYYEWFSGADRTDWTDVTAAVAADTAMLRQLREMRALASSPLLGVNVSFLTAVHVGASFAASLAKCLPAGSVVEITEHAALDGTGADFEKLAATSAALTANGFHVALDDCTKEHPFGDPMLWRRINPRFVKVGVRDETAPTLVGRAARAGLPVVVEQVESIGLLQFARQLGAQGFQGHHIGMPLPYSADLLQEGPRAQFASAS